MFLEIDKLSNDIHLSKMELQPKEKIERLWWHICDTSQHYGVYFLLLSLYFTSYFGGIYKNKPGRHKVSIGVNVANHKGRYS